MKRDELIKLAGKTYDHGEEHLDFIEYDIEDKYGITDPQFIICRKLISDRIKVAKWIDKWFYLDIEKWVQYKHIKDNVFELKECFPNPPEEICFKFANKEVRFYKSFHPEGLFWIRRSIFYNQKHAHKEMFLGLRSGLQHLSSPGPIKDPNPLLNRIVYKLIFDEDEYGRLIPNGYLVLEKNKKNYMTLHPWRGA